jgi:hypothetical protein
MTVEISFQAELALPPLPGGNSQKTVRFHYLETTDFDCHRVENQFAGGAAAPEVQWLSRGTLTPATTVSINRKGMISVV